MKKGRRMLAVKETMAYIRKAKVPIRVASSHSLSVSSGVRSGWEAK